MPSCVIIDAEPDWFAWGGTYVAHGCRSTCFCASILLNKPPRHVQPCVTVFVELWPLLVACLAAPSLGRAHLYIRPCLVIRNWLVFLLCMFFLIQFVYAMSDLTPWRGLRFFHASSMLALPCTIVSDMIYSMFTWLYSERSERSLSAWIKSPFPLLLFSRGTYDPTRLQETGGAWFRNV